MIPDSTTPTPAPQAAAAAGSASANGAAPGSQPSPSASQASASPAPQPTPVQLLWEVARMAFVLMTRLIQVLQPIQSYYLNQSRQIMRVCTELCRVMLTIRFAPERITHTQLRHLTRARHILQALFNYTLPLGPRTSPSANATFNQSPSAFPENATPLGARTSRPPYPTANQSLSSSPYSPSATPLGARTSSSATTPSHAVPAVPAVPEVPEVPEVPGVASPNTPSAASSKAPAAPTSDPSHPSHTSYPSHPSHFPHSANPHSANPHSAFRIQHSAFSPYIPDVNTLVAAVRAATLPPNCAGALVDDPGEALVRALHELHAVYFSLYPNQPPTPTPVQSPSPSSVNLQSGNPQSKAPSVSPVSPVNPVHSVQSVGSVQSVRSDSPQSEISNLKSAIPHSAFPIPHSHAPP